MKKVFVLLAIASFSTVSCSTAPKEKAYEPPEFTVEGLERVESSGSLAVVYAEPGANIAQYNRVNMTEPQVAFKKNWARDYNRGATSLSSQVRTSDMDRIKRSVSELFVEVFTEELTAGGYELTQERAEDVLLVKPAIIDLDVNAPDIQSAGRSSTFTETAGSMTFYVELFDSETGDLLAKAMDPKSDRNNNYMQWQTGASNRAAAKRMMKPWAEALREGLDRARQETGE
jgi:uncharacterized lipoprotein YajG